MYNDKDCHLTWNALLNYHVKFEDSKMSHNLAAITVYLLI